MIRVFSISSPRRRRSSISAGSSDDPLEIAMLLPATASSGEIVSNSASGVSIEISSLTVSLIGHE